MVDARCTLFCPPYIEVPCVNTPSSTRWGAVVWAAGKRERTALVALQTSLTTQRFARMGKRIDRGAIKARYCWRSVYIDPPLQHRGDPPRFLCCRRQKGVAVWAAGRTAWDQETATALSPIKQHVTTQSLRLRRGWTRRVLEERGKMCGQPCSPKTEPQWVSSPTSR